MGIAGWWARLRAKRPWWRVYPTRRLAALVLAAALAWIVPVVGTKLAVALLVAILAAVVFDYLRLPRRDAITVERTAPDALGLGDTADITYAVRSAWAWPARATLYDRIPEGMSGEMGAGEHDVPPLDERRPRVAGRRRDARALRARSRGDAHRYSAQIACANRRHAAEGRRIDHRRSVAHQRASIPLARAAESPQRSGRARAQAAR